MVNNMERIEKKLYDHFSNDSSFIKYQININNNHLATIYYFEGLVDLERIGEIIIKKIDFLKSIFT